MLLRFCVTIMMICSGSIASIAQAQDGAEPASQMQFIPIQVAAVKQGHIQKKQEFLPLKNRAPSQSNTIAPVKSSSFRGEISVDTSDIEKAKQLLSIFLASE